MIKAVDLRKGKTILHGGEPCIVHEAQHVAKGNKRSYMQTKIKNLKSGIISEVRFTVDERVEVPFVETKEYEFLYREGENYIVMDTTTFDQIPMSVDVVGDAAQWLKPNEKVSCELFNGQVVSFNMPNTVELAVVDTSPVVKGATATNQNKDAVLETGARIKVPPFVEIGTRINVDTRTGQYLDRAK